MFLPTCIIVCTAFRVVRTGRKVIPWFFFYSSRKLELLFVLHCVLSENLLFVVFTFQKKEKKRDTARFRSFLFFLEKMLDLDQIIAVATRTFRRRWNIPNFIIHYRLFFQCIILYSLLYSFPHFLSIFCSYTLNLPPI